jgi:hypothetical protein
VNRVVRKIFLSCGNERATDAAAPMFPRHNQCGNPSREIVMLVTGVCQRPNHSANLIVDLSDKCAKARTAQN